MTTREPSLSPGAPLGRRLRGSGGQATVELVALLPILVTIALAVGQLLAAGAARELAGHAAQAGAMAMLQGGDPAAAARASIPGWPRAATTVTVHGHTITVTLRPPSVAPAVSNLLAAHATASAGP